MQSEHAGHEGEESLNRANPSHEDETKSEMLAAISQAISERHDPQNLVVEFEGVRYVFQISMADKQLMPVYPVPERTPEKILIAGQIQQAAKQMLFGGRE